MKRRIWSTTPLRVLHAGMESPSEERELWVIYNAELGMFRTRCGMTGPRWTNNIREAALFVEVATADNIRRKYHANEPDTAVHRLTIQVFPPASLFDIGGEG